MIVTGICVSGYMVCKYRVLVFYPYLIFSYFSDMNALVLNLTALQANSDISNFEYQNISNMSYFLYFVSFPNESIQAVRAGNILKRCDAHISN